MIVGKSCDQGGEGSERCLWNTLKKRSFLVSDFRQGTPTRFGGEGRLPKAKKNVSRRIRNGRLGVYCPTAETQNGNSGQNFIERSVVLTRGTELRAPVAELTSQKLPDTSTDTLAEAERAHIIATLRETNWVV